MERIKVLINNLQEQISQNADLSKMLLTVQMLQSELLKSVQNDPRSGISPKVSVIMPQYGNSVSTPVVKEEVEPVEERKYIVSAIEPLGEDVEETEEGAEAMTLIERDPEAFDPMTEVPTLYHHQEVKEVNEKVIVDKESLNDRLRQSRIELGEVLKETPVKDLKKAIGINDRFTFINELFRGDESVYERSIKTINGFNIYAEAEYWINRELIVKMGWNINDETVKLFNQLVKRRFS
jgi:hypothetical protein